MKIRLLFLVMLVAVGSRAFAQTADVKRGAEVYQYWCASCHGPQTGTPGTTALAAKYKGEKPAVLDRRTDLTLQTVTFFVRNGVSVMAPFRKTEIGDADLAALAAYLSQKRP